MGAKIIELRERMRLLTKSIGYATIAAGLAGVTVAVVHGPEELKRKITSNGLVRVGRAARTVSRTRFLELLSCVLW